MAEGKLRTGQKKQTKKKKQQKTTKKQTKTRRVTVGKLRTGCQYVLARQADPLDASKTPYQT